jgi:hypothetical protein
LRRIAAADRRAGRIEQNLNVVTRPEWIFFGMTVTLCGMLASVVVLATGAVLAVNLINFRSTATTEAETLQERRRIVQPCLVMIGVGAVVWAIMMTLDVWWNLVSNAAFERTLLRLH